MIAVQEINDEGEFSRLKKSWNELLSKSQFGSPFLRWEWLSTWLRWYGANCQLAILLVKEGSSLIGIAPLITRPLGLGSLSIHQLQLLGSYSVGSDYLDLICQDGKEKLVGDAVFEHIRTNHCKWDAIQFTNIPDESKSIKHLVSGFKNQGYFVHKMRSAICPIIELPESWETYFSSLSKSTRRSIKRKVNRLNRNFEVEYEIITKRNQVEKALPDLIRLNRSRMSGKQIRNGGFHNEILTKFHLHIIPEMVSTDIVRICFLKVNHQRISVQYIFNYQNRCHYYQPGFDQKWEKYGPGVVILYYSIQHAIQERMKEFDFLQGDESYKFKWSNGVRHSHKYTIFNKGAKAQCYRYGLPWAERMKSTIKKHLLQNSLKRRQ